MTAISIALIYICLVLIGILIVGIRRELKFQDANRMRMFEHFEALVSTKADKRRGRPRKIV